MKYKLVYLTDSGQSFETEFSGYHAERVADKLYHEIILKPGVMACVLFDGTGTNNLYSGVRASFACAGLKTSK